MDKDSYVIEVPDVNVIFFFCMVSHPQIRPLSFYVGTEYPYHMRCVQSDKPIVRKDALMS